MFIFHVHVYVFSRTPHVIDLRTPYSSFSRTPFCHISRTRVCKFTYTPCDRFTYTLCHFHVHPTRHFYVHPLSLSRTPYSTFTHTLSFSRSHLSHFGRYASMALSDWLTLSLIYVCSVSDPCPGVLCVHLGSPLSFPTLSLGALCFFDSSFLTCALGLGGWARRMYVYACVHCIFLPLLPRILGRLVHCLFLVDCVPVASLCH